MNAYKGATKASGGATAISETANAATQKTGRIAQPISENTACATGYGVMTSRNDGS